MESSLSNRVQAAGHDSVHSQPNMGSSPSQSKLRSPGSQQMRVREVFVDVREVGARQMEVSRAQEIHRKKLNAIAGRKQQGGAGATKRQMLSVDDQERFFRNKQRIHAYKQSMKQAQIEKDNQKLLKKLVEISAGKKPVAVAAAAAPQGTLGKSHSVSNIEFKAKSLHFNQRKAELERIERENQKIARKIFCLKSDLNKDAFIKDFNRHEAIKNNLARIKKKRMPVLDGRAGVLPPIDGDLPRQGSAPTSADARGSQDILDGAHAAKESDYYTVIAAGQQHPARNGGHSNTIDAAGSVSVPVEKAHSSRSANPVGSGAAVGSQESAKSKNATPQVARVETVAEQQAEHEGEEDSPAKAGKTPTAGK